jgi:apolipoprotein N-acyltransferase
MSLKNIPHNNPPRSLHFIIMGIALLGGASLTTAFSPLNQSNLAFLLPGLLLYIILSQSKKQAFLTGLCWGIGFFGVGVSWVYVSIHTFGNTPVPLALLITAY